MTVSDNSFYDNIVRDLAPNDAVIYNPAINGTMSYVFIAETASEKTVFKFSKYPSVSRTAKIANILQKYNIPVPQIENIVYRGQNIEKYPYMPGKTFYEYMADDMTPTEKQRVLSDILSVMKKISEIPTSEFDTVPNPYCHQIAEQNTINKTNCNILGHAVRYATQIMNTGRQTINHCDINPKNILLDTNKRLCGILDLGAISVCNIHYALALGGNILQHYGVSADDFYRAAAKTYPNQLNQTRLSVLQWAAGHYFKQYNAANKTR